MLCLGCLKGVVFEDGGGWDLGFWFILWLWLLRKRKDGEEKERIMGRCFIGLGYFFFLMFFVDFGVW